MSNKRFSFKTFMNLNKGEKTTNLVELTDADGNILVFPDLEEGATPSVGDSVEIPEGVEQTEFLMPDMSIITVENGVVTHIEPPLDSTAFAELLDFLGTVTAENATLKADKAANEKTIKDLNLKLKSNGRQSAAANRKTNEKSNENDADRESIEETMAKLADRRAKMVRK